MPASKQERVISMLAQYVVGKYPCPSGVIAQLIQECGWDLKTPKDCNTGRESYNLGNIKGVGPAGSVTVLTTEFYTPAEVESARRDGTLVKVLGTYKEKTKVQVKAKFRAYHNYGEAIEDHIALLKKARYVRAGVWEAKTPRDYAEALKRGGYATDPRYVENIMRIVDQYNLTRFDKPILPVEKLAKKAEEAVHLAIEQWQLQLADRAIDNLSSKRDAEGKALLNNAEEWKRRLRQEPQKVLEDLPWLLFVMVDRATNTNEFIPTIKEQNPDHFV